MKDKGFGDTFERFTKATGIKWLIITVTGWFGVNCGCKYRQDLLNKWFPYKQKNKMKKITLKDILDPISPKIFFTEYWNKKHLIIRRNKFKNLFTWHDFNEYMNKYPNMKGLQILDYRKEDDGRWCLDKVRKGELKLPMLSRQKIYDLWKEDGKSFVLPFSEYQKKDLVDICFEFEKYFDKGQANIYCSPKSGSKSFPAHADNTENFLFHTEGKQKWTIYKEFAPDKAKTILEEFVLEAGDLLYIPQFQFHKVDTLGPRIMISIHFKNKERQSLNKFKVTKEKDNPRAKWYDWKPEIYNKQGIKEDFPYQWRDKSDWKKKYL